MLGLSAGVVTWDDVADADADDGNEEGAALCITCLFEDYSFLSVDALNRETAILDLLFG